MRGWAALIVFALSLPVAGQEDDLDTVMRRVAVYVADYQQRLVGIVAEEHYRQNVNNMTRGGRLARQFRELKSDLLLVKSSGENRWLQFRDVFEVDRKPVRDRDERLYKLFVTPTETARTQAQVIQDESSRYNIGPVLRTVNVPILGLLFFDVYNQQQIKAERLKANKTGRFKDLAEPDHVWRIGFKEVGTPTLIRGANNSDLRSEGEAWVDSSTGRILQTQVISEDAALFADIEVTYKQEPNISVLVPAQMRELYRVRVNESRIDGRASYSRFRQFTVTTTEKPKPQ